MKNMTSEDMSRMKDMLAALNEMLNQKQEGEEPDFEKFMHEYGDFFPENPKSLEELLEVMAQRMATMEQILNSMSNLRYQGIICELYPSNVKIKKQLDYANKKNFDFVILIGEEEVKNDSFILKNMSSGEQNSYKIDTLEDQIKKLI